MYTPKFEKLAEKKIHKLIKQDRQRYEILMKKIEEVILDPCRYKRLRGKMFGLCRVHIGKHFVLTFRLDHKNKEVVIVDFDHHDKIYR
ncbi:MAG: type II toxin-antitoxin system RelE/ParE family toxin [Candidatus Diapherotrites archaeon]|nr:type II toxin-antitoxin system RelE/ParE family toxin [Candidatus Diapherotrites archaeon]